MPPPPATPAGSPPDPQDGAGTSFWSTFAALPRFVVQPFSLSALALVAAAAMGVAGYTWPALAALGAAVVLLVVGLRGTPREAVGTLVAGAAYRPVSNLSVSTPVERAGLTYDHGGHLDPLEAICFLHLYAHEGGSVGRSRIFPMEYFVDLMTAALVPSHLDHLTSEFVAHLRHSGRLGTVTTIAVPKRGNALLVAALARQLDLEPVFTKERPLFGKTIEGIGGRPKRALVADDISSDGEMLVNCVEILRRAGYEVTDAFVLIERPEGDAREALAAVGVALWPMCTLSDQDLESITARGRRRADIREQ